MSLSQRRDFSPSPVHVAAAGGPGYQQQQQQQRRPRPQTANPAGFQDRLPSMELPERPSNSFRPSSAKPTTMSILRSSAQMSLNSDDVPVVELQAAFEKAYKRMLQSPPPSVIDSVLNMEWKPKISTKNSKSRTGWLKDREKGWDSRAPVVSQHIQPYDAVLDLHCRRVVENPTFGAQIKQTRPNSAFLLNRRVIAEERRVQSATAKFHSHTQSLLPTWLSLVTTPAPTPSNEPTDMGNNNNNSNNNYNNYNSNISSPVVQSSRRVPKGGSPLRQKIRPATAPSMRRNRPESAARGRALGQQRIFHGEMEHDEFVSPHQNRKQLIDDDNNSNNSSFDYGHVNTIINNNNNMTNDSKIPLFTSLEDVLHDGPHLPSVFSHLIQRLERLWEELHVPSLERKQIRKATYTPVDSHNLSQLFYQVSRWTQYQTQLNTCLGLIIEREQLLKDVNDHLSLAGGVVDDPLARKLSRFYALSLRTLNAVTTLKTLYLGSDGSNALLQDYVDKIRMDTAALRQRHVEYHPSMGVNYQNESTDMYGSSTERRWEDSDPTIREQKVKLAAEIVLQSVSKEAGKNEDVHYAPQYLGHSVDTVPATARSIRDPSPRRRK